MTLVAGSKRRSLLIAGDNGMFMTRNLNVKPNTTMMMMMMMMMMTTEQYLGLIVRSDKSVAYVTNNKRRCLTFCTIEANY